MEVLKLSGVCKSFGERLFDSVTFSLARGEGLAVYGHNGCGKSTLLDIVAGLRKPDMGSVQLRAPLGYYMQNDGLQDMLSCLDNLMLEASLCGYSDAEARLRVRDCAEMFGVMPYLKKRLSRCSAGMRARLSFAAAMLPAPGLLLMDEAFGALDERTRTAVNALLLDRKRQGMAFMVVSHDKSDFAGLCERVLLLPSAEIRPL